MKGTSGFEAGLVRRLIIMLPQGNVFISAYAYNQEIQICVTVTKGMEPVTFSVEPLTLRLTKNLQPMGIPQWSFEYRIFPIDFRETEFTEVVSWVAAAMCSCASGSPPFYVFLFGQKTVNRSLS